MTMKTDGVGQVKILDEIINNATGLPLESQDLLLMMAKAMRYTRDCIYRTECHRTECHRTVSQSPQSGRQQNGGKYF